MRSPLALILAAAVALPALSGGCRRAQPGSSVHRFLSARLHPAKAASDADAEVLVDRCRLVYEMARRRTWSELHCHRAIRLLREEGLRHAEVSLEDRQELVHLSGRTVLPNGTIIDVHPSDIKAIVLRSSKRTGQRTVIKSFAFPRAEPGAVVEYRYTLRWGYWRPFYEHRLPADLPIRKARFRAVFPSQVTAAYRQHGFGPPKAGKVGMLKDLTWKLEERRATPYEPLQPTRPRLQPRVHFTLKSVQVGPFRSDTIDILADWSAATRLWWGLVTDAARERSWPQELDIRDEQRDFVKDVWRFVQRLDDRQPLDDPPQRSMRSFAEILRSGYASAYERAVMMLILLRERWDDAALVLIPDADMHDLVKDHPAPPVGADLGIWVPAHRIFLDPLCHGCEVGQVAPQHEGRTGVWVKGPGLEPSKGPVSAGITEVVSWRPVTRLRELEHRLEVSERGLMVRKGKWTFHGTDAAAIRHFYAQHPLSPRKREESLRKRFIDHLESGSVAIAGLDAPGKPLVIHLEDLLLRSAAVIQAGRWLEVPVRAVLPLPWLADEVAERATDVVLGPELDVHHSFHLKTPAGYRRTADPQGAVTSEVGSYQLTSKPTADGLMVTEQLTFRQTALPKAHYPALKSFLTSVREARRRRIVYERGAAATPPVPAPTAR